MDKKKLIAGATAAALALGGGGAAIAAQQAGQEEAPEQQATGSDLERAESAALEHTDGGRVTDTEVGDEEGYYEIEVTRDDGSQVDVHLNRDFDVIGTLSDRETPDDGDAPGDG